MDTNIRRSTRNRGSLYKSLDENILVVDSLFAVRKNNARVSRFSCIWKWVFLYYQISIASDNESEESSDSEVVLIDDSDASEQPTNKRKKTDESLDNVDQASDSYLTDSRKSDSGELPRKQTNKVTIDSNIIS
jgi:hypothetical protein